MATEADETRRDLESPDSISSRASSTSGSFGDMDVEVFASALFACGFSADRVADSIRLLGKGSNSGHLDDLSTETSDGSSVSKRSSGGSHRLGTAPAANAPPVGYAEEGSTFRMTSSSVSDASTVEAQHDNGTTNVSAQLPPRGVGSDGHRGGTPSRRLQRDAMSSVDSVCKGLEAIEHLYDRAHFTTSSEASSNRRRAASDQIEREHLEHENAAAHCEPMLAPADGERGSRHRVLVYPEDPSNVLQSRYVMHEDWCPASLDGGADDAGRWRRRVGDGTDAEQYYQPENVVSWIKEKLTPRHSKSRRVHNGCASTPDVIYGDATFGLHGDPASVWRAAAPPQHLSRGPIAIAGGYKMVLPIREQRVAVAPASPSTLPRSARVDRVARINAYRASWGRDSAVQSVLGKRDETSWRTRVSLEDYRRML